ncbi:hypothetical protein [Micromonospora profundi]|uniref:hypothetical protein n=1 Tax=Micromonospora profundi TaxID=1420889 RepID=UPI00365D1E1C
MATVTGHYQDTPGARFARDRLDALLRRINLLQREPRQAERRKAWFHAMPDFSPSLNEERIASGLPVGGLIGWQPSAFDFVPASIPANGCGVLVGRQTTAPNYKSLLRNVVAASTSLTIGDRAMIWDAGRKNHFLNIYRGNDGSIYTVLHCSLPEFKQSAVAGIRVSTAESPEGSLAYYKDAAAEAFRAAAELIEELALEKRRLLAAAIFPEAEIIFNHNHVRMVSAHVAAIGCYVSTRPILDGPLTIGPGEKAFLTSTVVPTNTPAGTLYLQPHGTGNAMSRPGLVRFNERHRLFYVARNDRRVSLYDTATDVFDTYPNLDQSRASLAQWLGSENSVIELVPLIETKLRTLSEVRTHGSRGAPT